jgi:hypothetical protein
MGSLKKPLTFQEWCDKYEVSSRYVEPSPLFTKNPSSGIQPLVELYETSFERFIRILILHLQGVFKIR